MSIVIEIKGPDREGWLEKESRYFKRWKRRWFVLDGYMLYSFKQEKKYIDPTETIDLRVYSSVKSSDRTAKGNSFDLYSTDHTFSLIAETESQKEDWIRSLGRAIVMSHNSRIESEEEEEER
eukprot:UN00550